MTSVVSDSLLIFGTIPHYVFNQIFSFNFRFDFDQSAFSPTELDDSFMFHYRHPKNENTDTTIQSKIITANLPDNIQVTTVIS